MCGGSWGGGTRRLKQKVSHRGHEWTSLCRETEEVATFGLGSVRAPGRVPCPGRELCLLVGVASFPASGLSGLLGLLRVGDCCSGGLLCRTAGL